MTRDVVLGLSVLSLALLACGGGNNRPAAEGDGKTTLLAEKDMGSKAFDMPHYFALLSRKHGCQVQEKATTAVSACSEGMIGLGRNGTIVKVVCEGSMSVAQCKNLFDAIVAEGN